MSEQESGWETGLVPVYVGGERVTALPRNEITADKIKEIAREHGLGRFNVFFDEDPVSPDEVADKASTVSKIVISAVEKMG